jgi:hypothetical protein
MRAIRELRDAGVAVEAVVFGRGDLQLATRAGLAPVRASTPAELMKAFAGVFRRVVQAPYELDGEVASVPTFRIRPQIDEAWVVIYGDDTLAEASVEGPAGTVRADSASDRHAGAGAYRVAHIASPPAGTWHVRVSGGGPGAAYAVVQRG